MAVRATEGGYSFIIGATASGFAFSGLQRLPSYSDPTYVVWVSGTLCQTMNSNTGIVEYSGTSSTSGIQLALNNLTSGRTWKETVKVKGHHNIAKLLVPSYLTLDCTEGRLFQISGTNTIMIGNSDTTSGNIYIDFFGGEFDGNRAGQTGGGNASGHSMIHLQKCSHIQFHHGHYNHANYHCFYLFNCPIDIRINDNKISNWKQEGVCDHALTSGDTCHHHIVTNNYFTHEDEGYGSGPNDIGSCAISTVNVSDYVFANNVVNTIMAGSMTTFNGKRSLVANNVIVNGAGGSGVIGTGTTSAGIVLSQLGDSRYDASYSVITGNIVRNMGKAAIHVQNAWESRDIVISNNYVDTINDDTANGITVQDADNTAVTGNVVHDAACAGIAINGNSGRGISNCVISNNICYNNGKSLQTGDFRRTGISVYTTNGGTVGNNIIQGNRCYDDQSSGTQKYGVITTETLDCIVRDNDLRGNTVTAVHVSGDIRLRVENNLGDTQESNSHFFMARKKYGAVYGIGNQGEGIFQGFVVSSGTTSGNIDLTYHDRFTSYDTSTTSGTPAGLRINNGTLACRGLNPIFKARFKVSSISGNCTFVGFKTNANIELDDHILSGRAGIGVGFTSVQSGWNIIHNDGTGSASSTQISGAGLRDTDIHMVEIAGVDASGRFDVKWDDLPKQPVTTQIPDQTDAFTIVTQTRNTVTESKIIWPFWFELELDRL